MNYKIDRPNFFDNWNYEDNKGELNLHIWNNKIVHEMTLISILDIKDCLYELSIFISNNLQPNRLECFKID